MHQPNKEGNMKTADLWQRLKKYATSSSATSFGSRPKLPLWKSVMADYACLFSFGLYKP